MIHRDNKYITKIVAASLLGDASIEYDKRDKGHTNFAITLIDKNLDHLEFIEDVLLPITSCSYYHMSAKSTIIEGRETNCKAQTRLRSKRHPFFDKFRERMYGTGRKSPDPHYLKLLDWEFLAIWYQQDGYMTGYIDNRVKKRPYITLGLCTHGFSYGENHLLRAALKEKLDLDFNVAKEGLSSAGVVKYALRLAVKDTDKLLAGVMPYTQPSFNYKVDKDLYTQNLYNRMNSSSKIEDEDMIQTA